MKRFIIGDGKVSKLIRHPEDVIFNHTQIEIANHDSVWKTLSSAGVAAGDIVINTAAKINLEWCEQNKIDSYNVNTNGAIIVADVCAFLKAKLVHIGSGCIFDGGNSGKLFDENHLPSPASWYARTKAWADDAISNMGIDHLILRPRQLISMVPYPTNMLTKFLNIGKLNCIDEPNSITCIEDFADMIDHLILKGCTGIYNCANDGVLSPYEIAMELKRRIDPMMEVKKIKYDDYVKTLQVKRVNTILDLKKLKSTGYSPPSAYIALDRCLSKYGMTI